MPAIVDRCLKGLIGLMAFDLIIRGLDFIFSPVPPPPEALADVRALGTISAVSALVVALGIITRRHYITMVGCICAAAVSLSLAVGWVDDLSVWPPTDWRNWSRYLSNSGAWGLAAVYAWTEAGIHKARKEGG